MIANPPAGPSMNAASEKDPFNNNCYGTLVDRELQAGHTSGRSTSPTSTSGSSAATRRATARRTLPADLSVARSLIPAGTASLRDFSYIAPEIPEYIPSNCTGCMDCVTECPDTAILGKVLGEDEWEQKLAGVPEADREMFKAQWSRTKKYYEAGRRSRASAGCSTSSSTRRSARGARSA